MYQWRNSIFVFTKIWKSIAFIQSVATWNQEQIFSLIRMSGMQANNPQTSKTSEILVADSIRFLRAPTTSIDSVNSVDLDFMHHCWLLRNYIMSVMKRWWQWWPGGLGGGAIQSNNIFIHVFFWQKNKRQNVKGVGGGGGSCQIQTFLTNKLICFLLIFSIFLAIWGIKGGIVSQKWEKFNSKKLYFVEKFVYDLNIKSLGKGAEKETGQIVAFCQTGRGVGSKKEEAKPLFWKKYFLQWACRIVSGHILHFSA